jgi:hypothetical protein
MFDQGRFGFALGVLAVFMFACERSTEPDAPSVVAFQVPGCGANLVKASASDSCFSYQFHDALIVDFCATANCCPDSNRFSLSKGSPATLSL